MQRECTQVTWTPVQTAGFYQNQQQNGDDDCFNLFFTHVLICLLLCVQMKTNTLLSERWRRSEQRGNLEKICGEKLMEGKIIKIIKIIKIDPELCCSDAKQPLEGDISLIMGWSGCNTVYPAGGAAETRHVTSTVVCVSVLTFKNHTNMNINICFITFR